MSEGGGDGQGERKVKGERDPDAVKEEAQEGGAAEDPFEASLSTALVECAYCRTELMRCCRITCAVSGLNLCAICFSVGVSIGEHRPHHPYRVSTNLGFSIFSEEWTAAEELQLNSAIRRFGLGNWKDISENIATKSERKCQDHFLDCYLGRERGILPARCFGADGRPVPTSDLVDGALVAQGAACERDTGAPVARAEASDGPGGGGAVGGSEAASEEPRGAPAGEDARVKGAEREDSRLKGAEISGYMPLRGDFDVEHENDAELLLADMQFAEGEHPSDVALKLEVIRIYNRKLDERQKRKDFVVRRGLLDYKRVLSAERRRPKEEREIISRMRPFARFQSPEEHEAFIQGMLKAKKLRRRIEQLQFYRSIGAKHAAEGERLEDQRRRLVEEDKLRKSAPYLFGAASSASWSRRDRAAEGTDANAAESGAPEVEEDAFLEDGTPGRELLSQQEVELCERLRVMPRQYLEVKDRLLRDFLRRGTLSLEDAKLLDGAKEPWDERHDAIFDFFLASGWIATAAAEDAAAPPAKRRRAA